ncbi:MAG: hypothetical protein ACLGP3_02115, partial [Acidobacteriota bacterium]
PTGWVGRRPYSAHPERLPISFQDHGNPVRYRNVWVRELGHPRHKEFLLPDKQLETYAGDYRRGKGDLVKVRRLPDGLLSLAMAGWEVVLHAESPTHFYALTTDVQCDFTSTDGKQQIAVTVGEDSEHAMPFDRAAP